MTAVVDVACCDSMIAVAVIEMRAVVLKMEGAGAEGGAVVVEAEEVGAVGVEAEVVVVAVAAEIES